MLALLELLAVNAVPEALVVASARPEMSRLVVRRVRIRDYIPFPNEFRKLLCSVAPIQDIGGEIIGGSRGSWIN